MSEQDEYISLNNFKQFEQEGDSVAGELLGRTEVELLDGKTIQQYTILADEGLVTFNETFQLTVLRRVPTGARVKVTYTGEGPRNPKGNPIKQFDVAILKKDFAAFGRTPASIAAPASDPALAFEQAGSEGFSDPFHD